MTQVTLVRDSVTYNVVTLTLWERIVLLFKGTLKCTIHKKKGISTKKFKTEYKPVIYRHNSKLGWKEQYRV